MARIGPRPTLIERDAELPAFDVLLAERDQAHAGCSNAKQGRLMPGLREFQATFARDVVVARGRPVARRSPGSRPGFSVYRNTVMAGCVDALPANYPTVDQLVGVEWLSRDRDDSYIPSSRRPRGVLARLRGRLPRLSSSLSTRRGDRLPTRVALLDRCLDRVAPRRRRARDPVDKPRRAGSGELQQARLRSSPRDALADLRDDSDLHDLAPPPRGPASRRRAGLARRSALIARPPGAPSHGLPFDAAAVFLSSCASGKRFEEAIDNAEAADESKRACNRCRPSSMPAPSRDSKAEP